MSINPASLTFVASDLEADYANFRDKNFSRSDTHLFQLQLFAGFVHWYLWRTKALENCADGQKWAVVNCVLAVAQFLPRCFLREDVYLRNRTPIIVAFRMCQVLMACCAIPCWSAGTASTYSSMVKKVLLGSGALSATWLGLALPLPLRWHCLTSLIHMLLSARLLAPPICHCITQVDPISANIVSLWRSLEISAHFLSSPYLLYSPTPDSPSCACRAVVFCTQAVLGFIIPTVLVVAVDVQSRHCFLLQAGLEHEPWFLFGGGFRPVEECLVVLVAVFSVVITVWHFSNALLGC